MPKVSICIPAFEQVEYLKKTLDSIQVQSFTDYEIVLTDDSRSDIVKDLIGKYDFNGKLNYIRNVNQLGSPENWNEAVRKASGEYIKIVHHDDWFAHENSLAEFVKLLDNNPNADLGFSDSYVIFEGGEKWIHSVTEFQLNKIIKHPHSLFQCNYIGAPTATIYRKNEKIFFDSRLKWLVDLDFYIRLLNNNNSVIYCKKALVVTFSASGRVTDYCKDNKVIEVFEYFYVFHKIIKANPFYKLKKLRSNFSVLISVCKKYDIKSIKDIRQCGYDGNVHWLIKLYFILNKNLLYERIFSRHMLGTR